MISFGAVKQSHTETSCSKVVEWALVSLAAARVVANHHVRSSSSSSSSQHRDLYVMQVLRSISE